MAKFFKYFSLFVLFLGLAVVAQADFHLFMPDGQPQNFPVKVFVTYDITDSMNPNLSLLNKESVGGSLTKSKLYSPIHIIRNQTWLEEIEGTQSSFKGTLLLFDLADNKLRFYETLSRVVPLLIWYEEKDGALEEKKLISLNEVYIGNRNSSIFYTIVLFLLLNGIILILCKKAKKSPSEFLKDNNNRFSLSRVQIAAWTFAIAFIVTVFGLMNLSIDSIPETLIVLMGLSFVTGGVSAHISDDNDKSAVSLGLSDILCVYKDGENRLDIPRAQMFIWTGVVLALFFTKSLYDGILWEVPWQMVALMGISQAAYLNPKFKGKNK